MIKNKGMVVHSSCISIKNGATGITMIGLIVTIIVLLILAGVSISMILGNNGVLTQAAEAAANTNMGRVIEEVNMALAAIEMQYYNGEKTKLREDYYIEGNLEKYLAGEILYKTEDKAIELEENKEYIIQYNGGEYIIELEELPNGSFIVKENIRIKEKTVEENPKIKVTEISIIPSITLKLGEKVTETLTPTIKPSDAENKSVTWSSSNAAVATVKNGLVTAKAGGRTIITCTSVENSAIKATCIVRVRNEVEAVPGLVIGDYINYVPKSGQYEIKIPETGHTADQAYNTSLYTGGWNVIYNDDINGLQIISTDNVLKNEETEAKQKLTLRGEIGYTNLVGTLNKMAGYYVNDTYAINGRCVGSLPTDTELSIGTTLKYSNTQQFMIDKGWNDKYLVGDTNHTSDNTAINNGGINSIPSNTTYWIASRHIGSSAAGTDLRNRYVSDTGVMSNSVLLALGSGGNINTRSYSNGFRPVMIIKPGVEVNIEDTNKDGSTQEKAWDFK